MEKQEMVVITGLSGAGKSCAIGVLEDIGYYCVDNLPPNLIPTFAQLINNAAGTQEYNRIAIVADIRSHAVFSQLEASLREVEKFNFSCKIIYLDASVEVLLKRFKLTRRRHPLMEEAKGNVEQAIRKEKERLENIRQQADFVIDTTYLTPTQLKERLTALLLGNEHDGIQIHCESFGFKYGVPTEADLMFDVRCLPNPYWVEELKQYSGLDKPVRDYVFQWDQSKQLVPKLFDLMDYLLPLYVAEGKSQLVIAIGCTGGRHRSVAFAQLMGEHLMQDWKNVSIHHRDILK